MPPRMVQARVKARRAARGTTGGKTVWAAGTCASCSTPYLTTANGSTPRYCSTSCKRAIAKDRRRALQRGAYVSDVVRREIYERDGWTCQLCMNPVDPMLKYPHTQSASLDHVTPLAMGGTHEPSNCQLAHFLCNSVKGDRVSHAAA